MLFLRTARAVLPRTVPPPAIHEEGCGGTAQQRHAMPAAPSRHSVPFIISLTCLVIVIAALHAAREVCIPVALAFLLTLVLTPVASRLERWRFPPMLASASVVLLLCAAIVLVGWLVAGQVIQLADMLPQYQESVHKKLESLHARPGGTLDRLNGAIQDYAKELDSLSPAAPASGPAAATETSTAPKPIEVKLAQPPIDSMQIFRNAVLGGLRPLVTLGIVLVLVLFILVQRDDLRDRLIRLLGRSNMHTTTQTMEDAVERVSRYLLLQLLVNCVYGVLVAAALYFIGVPYGLLFGLIAAVLRFLPYFGVPVAALLPIGMAFVAAPGFREILEIVGLFVVLEVVTAYLIEPWLYGAKTGISPLAILVSALFWAWIWGPAGLLLSTPLTVCLAVLGRHVERLEFLSTILGDEPALSPPVRFYQRLLAGDAGQAGKIAREMSADMPLARVFDRLFVPVLIAARRHRRRGDLDDAHQRTFRDGICLLMDELLKEARAGNGAPPPSEPAPPGNNGHAAAQEPVRVLCFATHDFADECAARMLAGLLENRQIPAQALPLKMPPRKRIELIEQTHPEVVCVSAVSPRFAILARQVARRLRRARHRAHLVVGLWQPENGRMAPKKPWPPQIADEMHSSMSEALDRIAARLAPPVPAEPARTTS